MDAQTFLSESFEGNVPEVKKIWLEKDLREKVREIMTHDLGVLRIRYWGRDGKTAWIIDEVGKEKPITFGVLVKDDKIANIEVLAFRESRGWEIRYPFFKNQFKGVGITENNELNGKIDGISGATLSVRAMTRISRLAILLHQQTQLVD